MTALQKTGGDLYVSVREVLVTARTTARRAVNDAMVQAYWHIGRLIVENEQCGERRAEYGKRVLPEFARRLTDEFGKGFSAQSLWNFRHFYLSFPIFSTAWRELSWSHFRMLMRVEKPEARKWYADEAIRESNSNATAPCLKPRRILRGMPNECHWDCGDPSTGIAPERLRAPWPQ